MSGKYSVKKQIGSLSHALRGIGYFLRSEPKAIVHFVFDGVIIATGLLLHYSVFEWTILVLGMLALLSIELLNTSIEELCDFIEPEWNQKIKIVKDLSSGAVLLIAVAVGIVYLYFTYLHLR